MVIPRIMAFYPAFLDLKNKAVVVIGGGPVALQKARALAAAGARVSVVAPEIGPGFRRIKTARLVRRPFRPGDLAGRPWLVVAATDDEAAHARIARLCRARGLWLNVVDRPAHCDFIVPAVVRRGILTAAVSTGGASPALAKFVGAQIRGLLGPEHQWLGNFLKRQRRRLLAVPMRQRKSLLESFLSIKNLRGLRAAAGRARFNRRFAAALKNI